jgi:hypothetical protein
MKYIKRIFTFVLAALSISASAGVIPATGGYEVIDGTTVTRTFNVTERGTITDLNLTVEFSKCDDPAIGPTGTACLGRGKGYEDEFSFRLVGPDGREVSVIDPYKSYNPSTKAPGRVTVTYDDEAMHKTNQLESGSFIGENPLSLFDGMDMFGEWTLFMQDYGYGDPLEFFSSNLGIAYDPIAVPPPPFVPVPDPVPLPPVIDNPSQVPEPAAPLLLGLGIMGIIAVRRKQG